MCNIQMHAFFDLHSRLILVPSSFLLNYTTSTTGRSGGVKFYFGIRELSLILSVAPYLGGLSQLLNLAVPLFSLPQSESYNLILHDRHVIHQMGLCM